MKFDEITTELGEFGVYQKRICLLVCLCAVPSGLQALSVIFTLAVPEHRCAIPELENDSFVSQGPWHDDVINRTIPWDDDVGGYSQCRIYAHNSTTDTEDCSHYVYSKEDMERNLIMDLDLVCAKVNSRNWGNMVFMSGVLLGAFCMGPLSDAIGRKKVLMLCIFGYNTSSLAIAFATNFLYYVATRFLSSFFGAGFFMTAFVLGMEFVGPSKRTFMGIVIEMFWCIGLFGLCLVNFLVKDWYIAKLITAVPGFFFFALFWLMPESPRWLIQKGRLEEAKGIIQKVASVNGVILPEKMLHLEDIEREGHGEKVWHMFSSPKLLVRCLIIFFNWFVASMVYYGLSLNVGALSGNIFLNFTISTLMELASYFFCLFLLDVVGRKVLQCFSCFLGGLACVGTIFPVIFDWPAWITISLSMIGKFGGSAAFAVIYVFSAELFPTCVRNSGMGFASTSARVGGVLAPYIADLGLKLGRHISVALPLIIFGGLCIAGGVAALWLPETLNKVLPETVDDARTFGIFPSAAKKETDLEVFPSSSTDPVQNGGTVNSAFADDSH